MTAKKILTALILAGSLLAPGAAGAGEEALPAGAPRPLTALELRDGSRVQAELIKETQTHVFLDLGFTVLRVPREEIARREGAGAGAGVEQSEHLWAENLALRPATVKAKAEELAESVVLVRTPGGLGSGFIIHEEGYVITNYHVIAKEQRVGISLYQRRGDAIRRVQIMPDQVRILALNPFLDLALLQMERPEDEPDLVFRPVFFGRADELRNGQPVFAIGNPLNLDQSVSEGIVSQVNRANQEGKVYIQTTAPINPGNSGGPLFNLKGEVVGVTNAKVVGWGTEGLGFAIPVDWVKYFLEHREAFAFDRTNPNSGYHYLPPPGLEPEAETEEEAAPAAEPEA